MKYYIDYVLYNCKIQYKQKAPPRNVSHIILKDAMTTAALFSI